MKSEIAFKISELFCHINLHKGFYLTIINMPYKHLHESRENHHETGMKPPVSWL